MERFNLSPNLLDRYERIYLERDEKNEILPEEHNKSLFLETVNAVKSIRSKIPYFLDQLDLYCDD